MPLAESLMIASLCLTAVGTTATVAMAVHRMKKHRKPRLRSRTRTYFRANSDARVNSHHRPKHGIQNLHQIPPRP